MWSELTFKHTRPAYICTLYRPPTGSIPAFQQLLESKVLDLYAAGMVDMLIMGDVNIDISSPCSTAAKSYLGFLKDLGLTQTVTTPTRITTNTKTTIDHCITNREDLYHTAGTSELGLTDYALIYTNRKKLKINRIISYTHCRSFRNFENESFQHDISNIVWDGLYEITDFNAAATILNESIISVTDIHAPFIRLKCRDNAPGWLNGDLLRHLMRGSMPPTTSTNVHALCI